MATPPTTATDHTEKSVELADQLAHLLARIALKDQKALRKLYDTVGARLNGVAMKILWDNDLSNDVLQETFLQIWHNAGEYRRDQSEPMTWMTSLLRYRALDKLRAEQSEKRRRDQYETVQEVLGDNHVASPINGLLQGEVGSQLQRCLDVLDVANRNAILMAYYYGYSREDIAVHVAQPVNTIKSWLKRGLARLAQCLNP